MKKKLSEEAFCPFHLLLYEQTIKTCSRKVFHYISVKWTQFSLPFFTDLTTKFAKRYLHLLCKGMSWKDNKRSNIYLCKLNVHLSYSKYVQYFCAANLPTQLDQPFFLLLWLQPDLTYCSNVGCMHQRAAQRNIQVSDFTPGAKILW